VTDPHPAPDEDPEDCIGAETPDPWNDDDKPDDEDGEG
jgi:hypothetical protein